MGENHRWVVEVNGKSHDVEIGPVGDLGGPPLAFTCDGVRYRRRLLF